MMKTLKLAIPFIALSLLGCPGDDTGTTNTDTTTSDDTTQGPTSNTMTQTQTETQTATDPDTTIDPDTTVGPGTDTDPTGSSSSGDDPYVFNETQPEDYSQLDRMGFPAVNTGLNLLGDKDAYNAATPADDAALTFVGNVLESLETLHLGAPGMQTPDNTGLDDDLLGLGIQPCVTPPLPMDNCDDQGAPFVLPDVVEIVPSEPGGFPNGRMLADPVMDIILAVILVDLGVHDITLFLDLDGDGMLGPSLNPLQNDVEFQGDFPYLAPAH